MSLLHFHSAVTVILHNNGFVAVTQHYAEALLWIRRDIDKRVFSCNGELCSEKQTGRTCTCRLGLTVV
jgi:hypothetical protein